MFSILLTTTVVSASVVKKSKVRNVVRRAAILIHCLCKVNRDRHLLRMNLSHRIAVLHIYDVFAMAHPLETIRFSSVIIFYGDDPSLLAFVFVSITVATNCLPLKYICVYSRYNRTVANSFVGNSNRDFSDRRKYIAERVLRDGGAMNGGGIEYFFMFI